MFVHRNITETNERGALMIEAIALLGLMTMMSPMVVRQTADRTSEMEEVAVAGQIKELKDALNNWIVANYESESTRLNNARQATDKKTVTAADLAPYLSSSMIEGAAFRGNKMINDYKLGVGEVCVEKKHKTTFAVSPCNGADCNIGDTYTCSRYKMTGVVLSDSGSSEIEERRAARIASMIGADGGYMRTSKMATALGLDDDGKKKLLGTQGIWEGNLDDYFTTSGDDATVDATKGGRVAATTVYASGFSGDYLYRHKIDGMPEANSMFTDLDMCSKSEGNVCHRINNAGGLEVIGGKIIIRSENTAAGQDQVTDANTPIVLGTDAIAVNMANGRAKLNMTAGNFKVTTMTAGTSATASLNLSDNHASLNSSNSSFHAYGQFAYINARDFQANVYEGSTRLFMNMTEANLARNGGGYLLLKNTTNPEVTLNSSGKMDVSANTFMNLSSGTAMNLKSGSINLDAGSAKSKLVMNASGVNMNHGTSYLDLNHTAFSAGAVDLHSETRAVLSSNNDYKAYVTDHSAVIGKASFVANAENPESFDEVGSKLLIHGDDARLSSIKSAGKYAALTMGYSNTPFGRFNVHDGSDYSGFSLIPTEASMIVNDTTGTSELILRKDYLTLHQSNAGIVLASSDAATNGQMGMFLERDDNRGLSLRFGSPTAHASSGNQVNFAAIALYKDSGRIGGSFFQPEKIIGAVNGNVVQNRGKLNLVNGDTGQMNGVLYTVNDGLNAAVEIINTGTSPYIPYNVHGGDPKYNRFRVDPAFISVMNDIKLTSRGGARLSEALPNYILKGIYVLSNDYRAGPWPCGDSDTNGACSFKMPYHPDYPEFDCVTDSPAKSCTKNSKYVTFDMFNKTAYVSTDDKFRWAHPFMGAVPAPGKYVKTKVDSNWETLYSHDEGPCPDGYQAVMTISPNAFEISKVISVMPTYLKAFTTDTTTQSYSTDFYDGTFTNYATSEDSINYNYGYLPADNDVYRVISSIIQGGTRVGIYAEKFINPDTDSILRGEGWRVAMGTVSPYDDDKFIWNYGGIPAGSWSAIAHTYCYFNPNRFTMPNMKLMKINADNTGSSASSGTDNVILTPMDNPLLGTDELKKLMQ